MPLLDLLEACARVTIVVLGLLIELLGLLIELLDLLIELLDLLIELLGVNEGLRFLPGGLPTVKFRGVGLK
jgi:hypothetical protein